MKKLLPILFFSIIYFQSFSQGGQIAGDLQTNVSFFQKDSSIGASNTPLYDNVLSGAEAWLNVGYSSDDFFAGVRFDLFNNSNLQDPTRAYTDQGLGFWYLRKNIKELTITAGYFYEQFGSGIVYRSFEDRGLGIDYATIGLKLDYRLNDNWKIKAFTGREKNLFSQYKPIIKGANIEGIIKINDDINLTPGVAYLNRTMDANSVNFIVTTISTYPDSLKFCPKYNVYVSSFYNTLNIAKFSWYVETAFKSNDVSLDKDGQYVNKPGSVLYTSLTYSRKGLGITLQAKRTENFELRTSPNEKLLKGILNYLPSLTKQNSLRLLARFNAQTLTLGEQAFQGDIYFTPKKGYSFNLNYSYVQNLEAEKLYQEINGEIEITKFKKTPFVFGLQSVFYNQEVYRVKPDYDDVVALTPFAEITYKFTKKQSLRCELQYQDTKQDYGSWALILLEYSIAPKWSFALSDMYNIKPNPEITTEKNHYYNAFVAYSKNAYRFTLQYVKQVEGINCTGGVCRYEPAFSGVKFGAAATF
jgi:hypothetical protein